MIYKNNFYILLFLSVLFFLTKWFYSYFISLCLLALIIVLLLNQPDVGQSILLITTWISIVFISGIIMALTNLMFTYLAWSGKSEFIFAAAVLLDDLAAAFATVAFVTFISMLVDRNYTATQYALLASIGTAGRTLMASSSGSLVDWLNGDWGTFFIITALMVIPSLVLLWFIRNKIVLKVN